MLGDYDTTAVGITTGSNNIMIGQDVRPASQTASNQMNIGNLIYATSLASGATASTGYVGIGTAAPAYTLDVNGNARINNVTGAGSSYLNIDSTSGNYQSLTRYYKGAALIGSVGATGSGNLRMALLNNSGVEVLDWSSQANNASGVSIGPNGGGSLSGQTLLVQDGTASTGTTKMVVKAGQGQNINLFEVQNYAGTPLDVVDSSGKVGIGTATPGAILDISASTDAVALPSGTVAQRPATPINGMVRYDSSGTPQLEAYVNGAWTALVTATGATSSISLGTSASTTNPSRNGDVTTGFFSPATNSVATAIGGTEMMRVNATGVGIGTNAPSTLLDVGDGTGQRTIKIHSGHSNVGDNAAVLSLFSQGNREGIVALADTKLYIGNTGGLANYNDSTIRSAANISIDTFGNVGIGTTSPASKLDVYGTIDTNGVNGLWQDATNYNLAVGASALPTTVSQTGGGTNGQSNIAVGYAALNANTTGRNNVALGRIALNANTTGFNNTALGYGALYTNTTGYHNTAVGIQALYANTVGTYNTAVGGQALQANTTGINNTAVGQASLYSNTTGIQNTAVGLQSLNANTTGSNNTAMGENALLVNTIGNSNTAIGVQALNSNTTGVAGTAIGINALYSNTTGTFNTAIGYQAGYDITTGGHNIAIGDYATTAVGVTTGSNNILIGQDVRPPSQTASNQMNIGNLIYATGLASGATASTGYVGIGTTAPAYKLDVDNSAVAASAAININSAVAQNSQLRLSINGVLQNAITAVPSDSSLRIYAGGGDKVTLLSTGKVGIGTTTPGAILDISASTDAVALPSGTVAQRPATPINGMVRYDSSGTPQLEAYVNGAWTALVTSTGSTSAISLGTSASVTNPSRSGDVTTGFFSDTTNSVATSIGGTEMMRVNAAGVGIGTTSPSSNLHVIGTAGTGIIIAGAGGNRAIAMAVGSNRVGLHLQNNGSQNAGISSNGRYLNFGSASGSLDPGTWGTDYVTIDTNNGNVGIGTTSPTYSLHIAPTAATANQTVFVQDATATTGSTKFVLKEGAGQPSGGVTNYTTPIFEMQNNAGTALIKMFNHFGGGRIEASRFVTSYSNNTGLDANTLVYTLSSSGSGMTIGNGAGAGGATLTSGTHNAVVVGSGFTPTSGTGIYNNLVVDSTINQTGGASGISRGLYINPTLTAAADWRSIQTTNNSGFAFYAGGTAPSYFGGNVGIGTTSPSNKLTINGDIGIPSYGATGTGFALDAYYSSGWKAYAAGYASLISQDTAIPNNAINFKISQYVNPGDAITWTNAMSVLSNGNLILGSGEATTTPVGNTLRGPSGTGTDIAGGSLTLQGGLATGSAATGDIIFKGAPVGSSGSTAQTAATYMTIKGGGATAGYVGIGTTSPTGPLDVHGNSYFYHSAPGAAAGGIAIKENHTNNGGYALMEISGTNSAVWTTGKGLVFANIGPNINTAADFYDSGNLGSKVGIFGSAGIANASNSLYLTADTTNTYLTSLKYSSAAPYPPLYVSAPSINFNTKSAAAWPDGSSGLFYGTTRMTVDSGGNVGIGTTTPGAILDISASTDALALPSGTVAQRPATPINGMVRYDSSGTPQLEAYVNGAWTALVTATGSTSAISLGTAASATNPSRSGDVTTGLFSAATGTISIAASGTDYADFASTGLSLPVGTETIKIGGNNAHWQDTTNSNMAIGASTLSNNVSQSGGGNNGLYNLAVGQAALNNNTTGYYNLAVGYGALQLNTTGNQNTAVGEIALQNNTIGSQNTAVGHQALLSNTTGAFNTAVGRAALQTNTTGQQNTAIGTNALKVNTTGSYNVVLGTNGLQSNTTGASNIAVGNNALNTNVTGSNNVAIGNNALYYNTVDNNTAVGTSALFNNTTGNYNTAVGSGGLNANTTGHHNTAVGYQALYVNTTGTNNSAFGVSALSANTTGANNTSLGQAALNNNVTGSNNTAVGKSALYSNLADQITAVGASALASNTTGAYNTAVGYGALNTNATGQNNTAMGWAALYNNTAVNNTAVGTNALYNTSTGISNTALGNVALYLNTTGASNTALGNAALYNSTTGAGNTAVGVAAMLANTTGSNNTVIGSNVASTTLSTGSSNILIGTSSAVDTPAAGTSNFLNIGNAIYATGLGGTTKIGIGTASPGQTLSIYAGVNTVMEVDSTANSWTDYSNGGVSRMRVGTIGGVAVIDNTYNNNYLAFRSNSVTQMVLSTNGKVGIGTTTPGAILDISASTDALALPSGTVAQRPATPINGMVRYDSSGTPQLEAYVNGAWTALVTATGSTSAISLGTSASVTNPSRSGDVTTGLFSAATGTVSIAASGTDYADFASTGLNLPVATESYKIAGNNALWQDATNSNLVVGSSSFTSNVSQTGGGGNGQNNTVVGISALGSNTTGNKNVAVGNGALGANTIGIVNTAVGLWALLSNTTGSYNVALGKQALQTNTTGIYNTGIGTYALYTNATGTYNTAIGGNALNLTTGNNNTALGSYAGYDISTGGFNIVIGAYTTTGVGVTTGSNNILIGQDVRPASQTASNQMNIGNLIYATGLASGATASTGNVAIGTSAPNAMLDVSQTGGTSGTNAALNLRAGNSTSYYGNNQIVFGYNGTTTYEHAIKTRHNSTAAAGNDIDFYIWNYGVDAGSGTVGTKHVMTLDGTGYVGIGTTTPGSPLAVWSNNMIANFGTNVASDAYVTVQNTRAMFGLGNSAAYAIVQGGASKGLQFNVNNSTFGLGTVMTISTAGLVGIATTTPGAILDISASTDALALPSGTVAQRPATPINGMVRYDSSGTPQLEAYVNGAWTALVTATGSTSAISLGTSASVTNPSRSGDVTTGFFSPATNSVATSIGGTEMMRVNATGVGIGTTSPTEKLDVNGNINFKDTGYLSANGSQILKYDSVGAGAGNVIVGKSFFVAGTNFSIVTGFDSGFAGYVQIEGSATRKHTQTSGNEYSLKILPIYNQTSGSAANTDLLINRTETAIGSGAQLLFDAQVGGASKFVVTNIGKVGIGTTTPAELLDVNGNISLSSTSAQYLKYYDNLNISPTSTNGILVLEASRTTGGDAVMVRHKSGYAFTSSSAAQKFFEVLPIVNQSGTAGYTALLVNPTETASGSGSKYIADFQVGGSSKVVITNTGKVGIGTTTPAQALEVNGKIQVDTLEAASATNLCINAGVLSSCSSSRRYKENIADLGMGLDTVMKMRPVSFKWKGRDENDIGFVAEEMHDIDPLLNTYRDGHIEGVKYGQLTAVLVNAVKAQQAEIQAIKDRADGDASFHNLSRTPEGGSSVLASRDILVIIVGGIAVLALFGMGALGIVVVRLRREVVAMRVK
jgi:hypothetical protein